MSSLAQYAAVAVLSSVTLIGITGCDTISWGGTPPTHSGGPVVVEMGPVVFSSREKEVLRDNYSSKGTAKKLPPGLQKKVDRGGSLPPGWQKKLARGEVLDGELYGHCQHLPPEIAIQLPNEHGTTVTIILEGKAVRLIRATREIIDVLDL